MSHEQLMPGETLGLLGGGQLGRMFAQAAASMGYHVAVLEPGEFSPAGEVSLMSIACGYDDPKGLEKLAAAAKAVTTEFENVPAASLAALAAKGLRTTPRAEAVAAMQNRNVEKAFIEKAGVPTAPHVAVRTKADFADAAETLFPGILKTARLGYDGKGQIQAASKPELKAAFEQLGCVECIFEKRLALKKEISVIVARGLDGKTAIFPVAENHHKNGILAYTVFPARIDADLAARAQQYAVRIAEALKYCGVLCVEFFILADDSIIANELAPRPHNSGHATIEACTTSQYEQQVRVAAGLPLGDPSLRTPAVMLNILGDVWFGEKGEKIEPDWPNVLSIPGAKLHLYGKKEARRARKMGHVTVVAATQSEALARAREAAVVLGLPFAHELTEQS